MALATDAIARVRLLTGDLEETDPILDDGTYEYILLNNNSNELDTAIECLEVILTYLTVNPAWQELGSVSYRNMNLEMVESRIANLKQRKTLDAAKSKKIPIMVRTDRKNWNDIDAIFKRI